MSENEYAKLELKYDTALPSNAKILLDGVPIKYVRGIKFISHIDNRVNIVQLELLATVDIESPVEVTTNLITFIGKDKYKLVKVEDD